MGAIFKRELRSYFTTPLGYVFVGVFLALSGFAYSMLTLIYSIGGQDADISTYFIILIFSFIILMPILTMKSFAEERRSRTEQLLLTSKVSLPGRRTAFLPSRCFFPAVTLPRLECTARPITRVLSDRSSPRCWSPPPLFRSDSLFRLLPKVSSSRVSVRSPSCFSLWLQTLQTRLLITRSSAPCSTGSRSSRVFRASLRDSLISRLCSITRLSASHSYSLPFVYTNPAVGRKKEVLL